MNNPRLITLYQLYIDNKCTVEELQELEALLRKQDNEQDFKSLMDHTWDEFSVHSHKDISAGKADEIYTAIVESQSRRQQKQPDQEQNHPHRFPQQGTGDARRPNYWLWTAIAASVIIIFSVTLAFYQHTSYNHTSGKLTATAKKPIAVDIKPGTEKAVLTLSNGRTVLLGNHSNGQITTEQNKENQRAARTANSSSLSNNAPAESAADQNTIAIPLAGQYHLTLPDGTLVYLNSASTLSYPTKFSGKTRIVTLKGEAYFEVAKNPKMPFRVYVYGGQQIEVLGTHFNVKAYPDEKLISTTLLEGSVKVSSGNEQVLLKPGQAAINDPAKSLLVKPADLEEVMAWKNGMFIFNNESITEIMKKISRWYDVEVVFDGDMENISFTGNYSRSKSLSSLLQNIELMEKVHFKMEGRRIIVIEK